mgnify:CR=1 FL=1
MSAHLAKWAVIVGLIAPAATSGQTDTTGPWDSWERAEILHLIDALPVIDEATSFYGRMFESADSNGDDRVSAREATLFQRALFASMDYDNDTLLTVNEFTAVDFGESYEAARLNRQDEVQAVLEAYFEEMDRNDDDTVTSGEHTLVFLNEFRSADRDGDSGLSQDEFISSMPIFARLSEALGW